MGTPPQDPREGEIEVKEGRFQARGWGHGNPWLLLYLPLAGALQYVVVLQIVKPGTWEVAASEVSLLVCALSMVVLAVEDVRILGRGEVKDLEISYADRREEGGALELSYKDPKGRVRGPLRVKSVTPVPYRLYRPGLRFPQPVEGTAASMRIEFEGRKGGLRLGFTSLNEMRMAYTALSGQGVLSTDFL